MKADTSRTTFDPRKHYQGVYLQQGRVQMDADWNEQVALTAHRLRRVARDIVGPAGVPRVAAGFACAPTTDGLDLTITPGRLHVAGQVCENETPVTLKSQPHWPPEGPLVVTEAESLPLGKTPNGLYLVELDVWSRTVTALEDPSLLEPALGGPDTTFRSQLIWQARLVAVAPQAGGYQCGNPLPEWLRDRRASIGTLKADTDNAPETVDDCELSASAGYRRIENQHYRVEIHTTGPDGTATFKWSRENGSVVVPWVDQNGQRLTMGSAAGDLHRRFASGDTIELLSDTHILQGKPGNILTVEGVADEQLTVAEAPGQIPNLNSFGDHPRIRRWEGGPPQQVVAGSPLPLEAGIQITFGAGYFHSGDYWSIPARTGGAGLLWPKNAVEQPLELPPAGIAHVYAPLALVMASGGKLTMVGDCRTVFPPLTDIRAGDVGFDNSNCGNDMQQADTVQAAIEVLCQREVGGATDAGCEIRIDPQDGIPLQVKLNTLLRKGYQHLCLCLAPGEHKITAPLKLSTDRTGLQSLHLRGCGLNTQIRLEHPVALDLHDLRIQGLRISATLSESALFLQGTGRIRLHENYILGQSDQPVPLILINAQGDIDLSRNRLQSTSSAGVMLMGGLFPKSVFGIELKRETLTHERRFQEALTPIANQIAGQTQSKRVAYMRAWEKAIQNAGVTSGEIESQLNRIQRAMTSQKVVPSKLSREFNELRQVGLDLQPAVALAIVDGNAHVHLIDNQFSGDLLLYGNNPGSLVEVEPKDLISFEINSASLGSFNARGNRFGRVRLATELTDQLVNAISKGETSIAFDIFATMAWSDNRFIKLANAIVANQMSFVGNQFNAPNAGRVATNIAQMATYTGNIGRHGPQSILYDLSSAVASGAGRAGNLLRFEP